MKPCFSHVIVQIGLVVFLLAATPVHAEYTTLQDAWVAAYQNNPSLEAERAKVRALDEQVSQALSHWRPSVGATGSIGYTHQYLPANGQFGANPDYDATTKTYGVQLNQPLFRGFRTVAETEAAQKQVMAGRAHLEAAEQQLFLDVAAAYLDIVRDEAIYATSRDTESVLGDKLKEINTRAQAGDLGQTDIQQALARLARAKVSALQASSALQADRNVYTRLVGADAGSLQRPVLNLDRSAKLAELLQQATTDNPNVREAQYAVEQAQAEVDLNKGSLLPEVNLVGSTSRNYGQNIYTPGRYDSSDILVQATIPLYEAGADYSKIRAAQQAAIQHRMELEMARRKAIETVRTNWQNLATADEAIKADQAVVDNSNLAVQGLTVQNRVGTRTTIDVLNGQQDLLDANQDAAKTQHDRDLAVLQIKAATGTLTVAGMNLPVAPYDPKQHYDEVKDKWIGFGGADDDIYKKSGQARK